ncbi:MAG TPA: TPM domain-containing protein [Actinomycetota bacterium]|nr:TPM domain-containing protein [Actinomycetota bacterium]
MTPCRRRGLSRARHVVIAVLLLELLAAPFALAQTFPEFTAPVVDAAGVVPDAVEQQVNAELNDYQARSGNQIAVAVVKSTGNRGIEDYGIDLARKWGVGLNEKDNGVLLLIAHEDRRLRIETGQRVDDELTDIEAGRIIRERITPLLRQGDVGAAVTEGTRAIRRTLGDTAAGPAPVPPQRAPAPSARTDPSGLIFLGFMLFMFMGGMGRRRRRRWGMLPILWGAGLGSGYGRSSGSFGGGSSGGGFSGGGFSGGGGGGFGGGGASGSW